ncbi:MAG: SEC-C domain-containing protein [Desulfatibacillum sp.]|nr:SEC-C domain-containing protein [Desulfatibacillum sp.]
MKISRNAPCPCGSGKKFKKCCMEKTSGPIDLLYRRLNDAHARLAPKLLEYGEKNLGYLAVEAALDEFMLWPEGGFGPEDMEKHESIFIPWLLYNWEYAPDDYVERLPIPPFEPIAGIYAREQGKSLETLERRIVEATVRQPFSFFEVVDTKPGNSFRLKDVFTHQEMEVFERLGSENTHKGDILFARPVSIDHVTMIMGCGPIIIPPGHKLEILNFKKEVFSNIKKISKKTLIDYSIEIRELYLFIYESLHQRPVMQNSDGELLCFHTLHYEIESPEIAFSKLHSLSVPDTEDQLREQAELDANGNISRVEIAWGRKGSKVNKALDNTVLGKIFIDDKKLKVEVNSAERAEKIKKKIKKLLAEHAVYRTTEIMSLESMLAEPQDPALLKQQEAEQEALWNIPEVQEQMEEMLMSHWENWVNMPIPALQGKTPMQAIKTPEGREAVEALLVQDQRNTQPQKKMDEITLKGIRKARELLGME